VSLTETPREPALERHSGAVILTLGILGLVLTCFPLGIVAWLAANDDLRAMDAGRRDPEGRPLVVAGKVCGVISTALGAVLVFVGLLALLAD
jgi:hypothetical protein